MICATLSAAVSISSPHSVKLSSLGRTNRGHLNIRNFMHAMQPQVLDLFRFANGVFAGCEARRLGEVAGA
jgi:hypothetical protein